MSSIEIINQFNGIIGAIAGSLSTLVITHLLKNMGKLKIYIDNWKGSLKSYGEVGCSLRGKTNDDLYDYEFSFELDIFNSSDSFKIMRNITISFEENNIELLKVTPNDESTRTFRAGMSFAEEIKIINIAPKQIANLRLSGYVSEDFLDKLLNTDQVYFKYNNEKDKVIKKLITKLRIERQEAKYFNFSVNK